MKVKHQVNGNWPPKAAYCLVFFAFWVAKCEAQLGLPPLITVPPGDATVQNGGTATFSTTIGASLTPLTITWRFNGTNIQNPNVSTVGVPLVGTTISTLTITNASAINMGYYSALVQNSGGSVNSGDALLTVLGSTTSNVLTEARFVGSGTGMTSGGFQLQWIKPASSNCVIEASADLKNWAPIWTNATAYTNGSYLDTAATNLPFRYYRARLQ